MENKLIISLCDRIYENPIFQEDFELLVKNELRTKKLENGFSSEQIKKLLESATIMSLSRDNTYQKLAFKIAIFLLRQYKNKYKSLPFVTELILTRLGDLPTISHMYEIKDGHDYFSFFHDATDNELSYFGLPEVLAKKILNQYEVDSKNTWNLTNFQASVLRNLINKQNVSFSAPTSAGKSYIIHNYIAYKMFNSRQFSVIYIAPTKSLIAEVQKSIVEKLRKLPFDYRKVAVVNSADQLYTELYENVEKRVLVVTQERLQYILSHGLDFPVDLLVVDEAQKVKEEERGVILEEVVEDVTTKNPNAQTVFISPFIKNPEKFQSLFNLRDVISLSSSKTPVGQNIFYVSLTKDVAIVSLLSEELDRKIIEIEKIPIENDLPKAQFRIKSWVVNNLLRGQGNTLIYCNRPTECVKIADVIALDLGKIDISSELADAIEFMKKNVHEQYYLTDHLQSGIGYHYGRMPHFVRKVVKELFEEKKIDILCCTSTLLEGVNLPAKNIVLHKPKAGQTTPMDKFSVKNLAGRAGRLGRDYYGNIYCVDIENWKDGVDTFDDELETIQSSTEKTLSNNLEQLVEHLENYQVPEYGTRNVASVATSLIVRRLKNPGEDFGKILMMKYAKISSDDISRITNAVDSIIREISPLDVSIAIKNSTIDPRLQYELFKYLLKKDNLVLPPEPWFDTFYDDLLKIFKLIQEYFFKDDKKQSNYKYYTFVANQWIHQSSYKQILEHRIKFLEEKKGAKLTKSEINASIDRVDEILESTLKYNYTRGLRCYTDIAEFVIKKKDILGEYSKKLPDYLETGAYDDKVFLLLEVGLTRNNAIRIAHDIPEDIDTLPKCIDWLRSKREKIKKILHPLMYSELEELF